MVAAAQQGDARQCARGSIRFFAPGRPQQLPCIAQVLQRVARLRFQAQGDVVADAARAAAPGGRLRLRWARLPRRRRAAPRSPADARSTATRPGPGALRNRGRCVRAARACRTAARSRRVRAGTAPGARRAARRGSNPDRPARRSARKRRPPRPRCAAHRHRRSAQVDGNGDWTWRDSSAPYGCDSGSLAILAQIQRAACRCRVCRSVFHRSSACRLRRCCAASSSNPCRRWPIRAYTATTALGRGREAQADALRARRGGLRRNDFHDAGLDAWIGRVDGLETSPLPARLARWECRNNRLAWLALQQDGMLEAIAGLRERHGADRVALVAGHFDRKHRRNRRGVRDAAARRAGRVAIRRGHASPDRAHAAFAGRFRAGSHGLARTLRYRRDGLFIQRQGVRAGRAPDRSGRRRRRARGRRRHACAAACCTASTRWGWYRRQACRPFDAARDGLSLGEAGGFAILERGGARDGLQLRGYGESSDAHHMSTPHPEGLGARLAMARCAGARRHRSRTTVGYLNLHGTATPANDAVEARAVATLFPDTLHASSTKGWTGHTLGAAGHRRIDLRAASRCRMACCPARSTAPIPMPPAGRRSASTTPTASSATR